MRKLFSFIMVVLLLVIGVSSTYGQNLPATITNRATLALWIRTGTFTFTNKTLTSPTINGLSLTGTISITGTSYLNLGTALVPLVLTTTPLFTVYSTSASVAGTIRSAIINQVHTGDGYATIEALRVNVSSAVQTGSWTNAIVARIAYSGATGDAGGGLAAALCAEVVLPAITGPAGSYFAVDLEFDAQASYVANAGTGYPTAYIRFGLYGNGSAIASFEDDAYFMQMSTDFSSASGNMWYNNTLRVQLETTDFFIALSDAEGEYSSAYMIDISNATNATNLTTASIATEGGLAVTLETFLGDDLDMSTSGTGVYDITLKDNVADALSIVRGTTDMMEFTSTSASPLITITPATTITGLLTANGSVAVGDADYIGITSNEVITFAVAGTITASGADFVIGETAAENVLRQLRIIGDADSDAGGNITSETLTIELNTDATPTNSTWDFSSTQGAGYAFDKAVSVTGLITSSAGFVLGDTDYIGITSNETISFLAAGSITVNGANFLVGPVTALDEGRPTFAIVGDADTDGTATTEALTWTLAGNTDPTAATWGLTSTQSAGYTIDKAVSVTGLVTSSAGFVLGNTDYIGITGNEIITFTTGGTIDFTGALVTIVSPDLAAAANNALIITATTSITTGSNYAVEITHTNTAGSAANFAGLFVTTTAGADFAGAMGIMSRVDMGAYEGIVGGANALYAELLLSNKIQTGGEYHVLVLTLAESGSTFSPSITVTRPTTFTKYETWGDGAEHIDDYAYLFYLNGFTAEAGHLVSLTKQTLRVNIGQVARYMVLSQMQDGLGLGISGTPMVLAATTDQATEIFTTGSSTSGNHFHNYMKATSTAQTTGGHFALYVENDVAFQAAGQMGGYFKVDMNAIQAPTGGASVVNAELVMPTGVQNGGQYNAFVADIECPATMDMFYNAAIPSGFMKLEVYGNGTAVTDFNLSANLFNLSGITAATDAMLEETTVADANVSITHSIRINIGGTPYYIALNTANTW